MFMKLYPLLSAMLLLGTLVTGCNRAGDSAKASDASPRLCNGKRYKQIPFRTVPTL
jgi:hypothetical protein